MPRLSQKTLEKMFQCPYCEKMVRNRAGLSGHIQFKHSSGTQKKKKSHYETMLKLTELKGLKEILKQSDEEEKQDLSDMVRISVDWSLIKNLVKGFDIKFNDADFKAYIIIASALMYSNRRLMNELHKELSSAITQLMDITNKMKANT